MTEFSTLKTRAEISEVHRFLERSLGIVVASLVKIDGGEGALAFDVLTDRNEFIFRLGPNAKNFEKDRVAYELFNSDAVPIPKVLDTGRFIDGLFFAMSDRVIGTRVDLLDQESARLLRPSLMSTLSAIHFLRPPEGSTYGRWGAGTNSTAKSWSEHVLQSGMRDEPPARDYQEACRIAHFKARFAELARFLPDMQQLCHGDYGFNNAFARDNRISGVIDWAESLCGDPLYDVAWLTFWSGDQSYLADYLATPAGNKFGQEVTAERMECYEIRIRLGALSHFARSNQWTAYESVLMRK